MPHVVACATNTNDVMHASHATYMLAHQPSLGIYDAPEITYLVNHSHLPNDLY